MKRIRGTTPFYDGFLASLRGRPRGDLNRPCGKLESDAWKDGWDTANEIGENKRLGYLAGLLEVENGRYTLEEVNP